MSDPKTTVSSKPRWTRRRRMVFGVVAMLLVLGGLEALLRAAAWATDYGRAMTFDPVVGWRCMPHIERVGDGWSADEPGFTNAFGWRDGEHAIQRSGQGRRLLALGDSLVFGVGVDYGQRFTELLETTDTEVVNIGVPAWGTDQQSLIYDSEGAAFGPDVVVWVVCLANDLDDIRRNRQAGWSKPYFSLEDGQLRLHEPQIDWTVRLRSASYLAELGFQVIERGRSAKTFAPEWRDRDSVPLFGALARRLSQSVSASGAHLLAVLDHPHTPEPAPPVPHAVEMQRQLEEAGIAVLSLLPAFAALPDEWSQLRLPCGHWTPRGHEIVAASIRSELERRGWW